MSKPLILVTAAAGKTGAPVVEQLLERSFPVRALVRRHDDRSKRLEKLGAEVVLGDFLDLASMRNAMQGVERVYFCYPPQVEGLVEATAIVATAARDAGVEALVNMSQISAREQSASPLARQHWVSELVLDWADIGAVHVRPTFFAEMLVILGRKGIASSGKLYLPYGAERHAPVAAADIASTIVGILADPAAHVGERYVVTGPRNMTIAEMAESLTRGLGRSVEYVDLPIGDWGRILGEEVGLPEFLVTHLKGVAEDHQNGVFSAQTDVVERIAGHAPQALDEFVRLNRAQFESEGSRVMREAKNERTMVKRLGSVIVASNALLAACAPQNGAVGVTPLGADATVEQRIVQSGLSTSLAPAQPFEAFGKMDGDRSFHADIAFYEVVLSYGPVADPRSIFLLTNAYIVTNQQEYGLAFLERLLKRYEAGMTADVRAVHLSANALLRASYAERVPIPGRIPWVLATFDMLEEAKRLSEENPLVRWSAGLIYAQVPGFFGKRDEALEELLWLVERPDLEPNPGFYREPYHFLSKLYAERGDAETAERYLKKSGYEDYEPHVLFMGWFATTRDKGLRFAPTPWIEEIVAGRVFAVRGFGFSDMHFVVSDDGEALISIDAGTQPYSMRAAHELLVDRYPDLPALTTVLVTHAHWDHVGGSTYLRTLEPAVRFYGRGNYQGTVDRTLRHHTYEQFRGAGFQNEWVSAYRPDITVDEVSEVTLGGTAFELIPVTGGETEDALLIHVPALGVLFMGDALMPFYGEPWVEEGFMDAAMDAMDEALRREPEHILHGHVGITVLYGTRDQLETYRGAYDWLVGETRKHLLRGYSAKDIIRLNLIPPGLQDEPQAFFGYVAPRDSIINRTADHMVGIWREDVTGKEPGGLDVLTSVEYGRLLELYLGLSPKEVARALRRMLDGGDNELALQMAVAAETRYPKDKTIARLKEEAADRLRSSAQYFDPFKFVTYTELIGKEHRPIPSRDESHPPHARVAQREQTGSR